MDYWGMTLGERFPNKKDRSARRTRFTIYGLKRRIWHLLGVQPQKILYSRSFAVPFRFLTPHRQGVSLWRVKSSDVRQSKIYKWVSGGKGLSRKESRWLSVLFAVLKLVPLGWGGGGEGREFKPRPQDRILVPRRFSFQNVWRAPPSFLCHLFPRGITKLHKFDQSF